MAMVVLPFLLLFLLNNYEEKDCSEGHWAFSMFIPVFTEELPATQFDVFFLHMALPV